MTAMLLESRWNSIGIALEWLQCASICYWINSDAIGITLELHCNGIRVLQSAIGMTAVLLESHWNHIGIALEWFQSQSKCYWNDSGAIGIALESHRNSFKVFQSAIGMTALLLESHWSRIGIALK